MDIPLPGTTHKCFLCVRVAVFVYLSSYLSSCPCIFAGKLRHTGGRLRHTDCRTPYLAVRIPLRTIHIPLRTSHRYRHTACRSAVQTDCCERAHLPLTDKWLRNRYNRQDNHWGWFCLPYLRNSGHIRLHNRYKRRCSPECSGLLNDYSLWFLLD